MNRLTVGESFKNFLITLNSFGIDSLKFTDEEIEANIFGTFITNSLVYLSEYTLEIFEDYGLIDNKIRNKCEILKKGIMDIMNDNEYYWNSDFVRTKKEWKRMMVLSDEISCMLKNKWTDDEIKQIFEINDLLPMYDYSDIT